MTRTNQPAYFAWLLFSLLIAITSCNNEEGNKKDDIQPATDSGNTTTQNQTKPGNALIGDPFHVLYTDKQTFLNFPNGIIVFSYVADASNKITLHGWKYQGPAQDYNPPVLELLPGIQTGINYSAGMYLGNVFIKANVVAAIKQQLNQPDGNFVALVPDYFDATQKNIKYKIFVTKESPLTVMPSAVGTLGYVDDANPSPPKGIN